MATGPLKKVSAKLAREVCSQFELSNEAKVLLDEQVSPDAFLDRLLERGHLADAVRLLAFALPKREAVWWSCQCVRECLGGDASPQALAAIKAAEEWVKIELEVHGDKEVIHRVNGTEVLRYQKPQLDPEGRIEATKDLYAAGAETPLRFGHIALQAEGQGVWFRNIELKPLEE